MRKKLLALALTLALVVSLCPATLAASTLKASEATTEVEKKLANLQTQSGFRPGDANSNCFAFAMSVTDKIFGIKLTDIEYHGEKERSSTGSKSGCLVRIGRCYQAHAGYYCKRDSSGAEALNEANVKSLLSQAKCGDVIQTTRKTSAGHEDKYITSLCETNHPHTMIVQSAGSNSVVVYEGNINGKVNVRSITYKDFASTYNHTITLFRAENYDKVNGSSSSSTTVTTNEPSTLKISPTTEPGENMPQGQPFYFKGKITSNYPIFRSTIYIYSPDYKTLYQTKSISPNTTTVDIATSGLDSLKFGQLSPGSYVFFLTAADESNKTVTWAKNFSIAGATPTPATSTPATPAPVASTLTISPINKPGQNMKLGEAFDFTAKITSNYNITSAQLDIREEGQTGVKQAHALLIDPSQKEVNYSTKDLSGIQFERLLAGSYHLYLTVKDSSGATKQWEQAFTIVAPATQTSEMYNIAIQYFLDGARFSTYNIPIKHGDSTAFDLRLERSDIPTLVALESGTWDEAYTLTFVDVHSNITANLYYETPEEETPVPTSTPTSAPTPSSKPEPTSKPTTTAQPTSKPSTTPEPAPEPSATPTPTSTGSLSNFHSVNTYYSGLFYDVASSDWFDENVSRAYELGLMKGMSDNAFDPNSSVTIAQAVTLAARLHSIYYTGSENFVQSGSNWYDVYVTYAHDNDILRGAYRNYSIPISRESFAHILARALPAEALPSIYSGSIIFSDGKLFADTCRDDIYLLAEAGIVRGSPTGSGSMAFKPGESITRAEVAAIVTRMADPSLRQ